LLLEMSLGSCRVGVSLCLLVCFRYAVAGDWDSWFGLGREQGSQVVAFADHASHTLASQFDLDVNALLWPATIPAQQEDVRRDVIMESLLSRLDGISSLGLQLQELGLCSLRDVRAHWRKLAGQAAQQVVISRGRLETLRLDLHRARVSLLSRVHVEGNVDELEYSIGNAINIVEAELDALSGSRPAPKEQSSRDLLLHLDEVEGALVPQVFLIDARLATELASAVRGVRDEFHILAGREMDQVERSRGRLESLRSQIDGTSWVLATQWPQMDSEVGKELRSLLVSAMSTVQDELDAAAGSRKVRTVDAQDTQALRARLDDIEVTWAQGVQTKEAVQRAREELLILEGAVAETFSLLLPCRAFNDGSQASSENDRSDGANASQVNEREGSHEPESFVDSRLSTSAYVDRTLWMDMLVFICCCWFIVQRTLLFCQSMRGSPNHDSDMRVACRSCGGTGVDVSGKKCICQEGRVVASLDPLQEELRGVREELAAALRRAECAEEQVAFRRCDTMGTDLRGIEFECKVAEALTEELQGTTAELVTALRRAEFAEQQVKLLTNAAAEVPVPDDADWEPGDASSAASVDKQ